MHKQRLSVGTFTNALRGIFLATTTQVNFRIHLFAVILVSIFAVWLKVSQVEGLILFIMIALVLTAEMINSAIESLGDTITLEKNPGIGRAKDVSAGAVLVTAIFSATIAALIFLPKIYYLLLNP